MKKINLSTTRSKRYVALAAGIPSAVAAVIVLLVVANQPSIVSLSDSTGTQSSQPAVSTTTVPTTEAPTTSTTAPFSASAQPCTSAQLNITNRPVLAGEAMFRTTLIYPLENISNSSCTVGEGMPTVLRLARASSIAALDVNTATLPTPYDTSSRLSASGAPNPFNLPESPITIAPGHSAGLWLVEGAVFPANVPTVQKGSPGFNAWFAQQSATPDSCEIVFSIPTPSGQVSVPLVYACHGVPTPEQQEIVAMYPITPTTAWTSAMETALSAHTS
ncbi:hypothetical protein SAMN02745225_00517 [Ferrithrix thermotolerans DSM 19514]|uniref:Uncharacterized protein n=1 Tax=Ferrithrix thermotolerans DSM 19514 TaxID=1121881 RepID=A0A1M4T617_9ACTN|nr:hypothetical protein [Ferrithrix thermotolerans]SHE39946.1 hypothetical protein SAMN02745225_00517 [Ferrithrix thermotolerans DSM 19514]